VENEDESCRPAPLRPYQPGSDRLRLPASALTATLSLLQRAGRRESGLFWYGTKDAVGNARVAYVVAPRQRMTWGNYLVSAEALAEVVHRLPDDWKPLAQVHSHPGLRIEHSIYDDRMASSRRALSLVFPCYGDLREKFPGTVGVHEFQNDYWYLLDAENAARRVTVCDGDVKVDDLR
jgi:hypothetical protein